MAQPKVIIENRSMQTGCSSSRGATSPKDELVVIINGDVGYR